MAPNDPHWYWMFIVCSLVPDLVAFRPFWAEKRGEISSKTAPISCYGASNWAPNGPKWSKKAPKGPHQYSIVILCPTVHNFGPFRPFCIAKQVRNWLQTGPSILLWALRSLHNGPNWSKIAPKGSQQYSMVILCPTVHDLGLFRPLWAKQNE